MNAAGLTPSANAPATRWEHFRHEADMGIRGLGPTPAAAFVQAALALTAVICEPERVQPLERVRILCVADDLEWLFVEWLDALIYEMATRRMLFGRFEVEIEGSRLMADAWGEPIDVARHAPAVEVKGTTLTELAVRRAPDGSWVAQCVVDV
ncbi:MAG TPA: archease [Gammaproteobacteria bacterium]|nr:archease [Gammaproteobacteria bacterium]